MYQSSLFHLITLVRPYIIKLESNNTGNKFILTLTLVDVLLMLYIKYDICSWFMLTFISLRTLLSSTSLPRLIVYLVLIKNDN